MRYAVDHVEPTQGARSTCPSCGAPVIAKCGRVMVWHWAHEANSDCDPWSEPTTEWHLAWQRRVPVECREVVIGPHRADIVLPLEDGRMVVEIQHSGISIEEIREREEFYGRMIWIFDATEATKAGRLTIRKPWMESTHMFLDAKSGEHSGEQSAGPYIWEWRRGRSSLRHCKRPVLLDTGDKLLNPWTMDAVGTLSGDGDLHSPDFDKLIKARPATSLTSLMDAVRLGWSPKKSTGE